MMIVNPGGRRRLGRLAGAVAAGVLAVGAVSLSATAGSAATAGTAHETVSTAGLTAQARAQVPWSKVGPGWVLGEYDAGAAGQTAPVTLYLISPAGVRYSMHTWTGAGMVPYLISWSGDKARALLGLTGGRYEQLTLSTGKFTVGRLAGQAEPTGYTLPDGQNILGVTGGTPSSTVARYSLAGKLRTVLTRGADEDIPVYAANGAALAVSGAKGLELVSNGGGVLRSLPVLGTNPSIGCYPERWWNATTVLTECLAKGVSTPRLWLVPTSGKKPVPLTPQRNSAGPDLGDIGAWQLSSGLYVQGLTGCGTMEIFRQAANGSIKVVNVPHAPGNNNAIVSALGARLLIDAQTGCPGSTSLLWFNPATHAEQWLLRPPAGDAGVIGVVAFNSTENAQPL
jgi:TolB protein